MNVKRYYLLIDAGGVQVADKAIEVVSASDYEQVCEHFQTYREVAGASVGADLSDQILNDAARWRALIASTGNETDMSSGPGKPKDMIVRINCTGCARWLESGAVDWTATLNAAMDDEIRLQATQASGGTVDGS